ncbi:hypothetical protein Tco_1019881 [Tanacetum coccineum]|uniref:Uncharacterized protein n=1 Tax=Tanacetum coccineum TaxID=301880 RepID=A0ABQ5FYG7_9ASTR
MRFSNSSSLRTTSEDQYLSRYLEVAEREEHVVEETREAEDVDESDKSDFDLDEIPPVELEVDMNDFLL